MLLLRSPDSDFVLRKSTAALVLYFMNANDIEVLNAF